MLEAAERVQRTENAREWVAFRYGEPCLVPRLVRGYFNQSEGLHYSLDLKQGPKLLVINFMDKVNCIVVLHAVLKKIHAVGADT